MSALDELRTRYKQIKRELAESPGDFTLVEKLQQIESKAKQLQQGIHKETWTKYNPAGYDKNGFDQEGYNKDGEDQLGFNKDWENMHPHVDPESYQKAKWTESPSKLDKAKQTIAFGKHKWKKWKDAPVDYLTRVVGKNFSPHVKKMAQYGIDEQGE